jgi:hypothetical protein
VWFLAGIAVVLFVLLMLQVALGATCTVRLHTAVQIEELTALRRFRVARRCLAILVPQIEALQGTMSPGDLLAHSTAPAALPGLGDGAARVRASSRAQRGYVQKPLKVIGSGWHVAAFAWSVVFGLAGLGELIYQGAAKSIVDSIVLLVSSRRRLVAAIRQSHSTLPSQTRRLTWTLLIVNGVAVMAAMYISAIAAGFESASSGSPPPNPMMTVNVMSGDLPAWVNWFTAAWGVVVVVIAVFGLLSVRGYSVVPPDLPENDGAPQP